MTLRDVDKTREPSEMSGTVGLKQEEQLTVVGRTGRGH
jgi:hypothetical protein